MSNLVRHWSTLLVVVVLVGSYMAFCFYERNRVTPPDEACSWETFLASMPPPREAWVFHVGGRQYVEVRGPMPSQWTFPSGPPSYVFNQDGILVDWAYDRGEMSSGYVGFHASSGRRLAVDEVPLWFSRGG